MRERHPGWASLASVCEEWQAYIAPRNLHTLKLGVPCLDSFEHMVVRQRGFVRHIWLNIELPRYTCRCCKREESWSWQSRNNTIISKGLRKLFSVLSTWDPSSGLTLELNAYSPSDSEHWFKDYHFASDYEGNGDAASQQETGSRWHDPKHGWVNGQQVKTPPKGAVTRLYCRNDVHLKGKLSPVDAISCLIIRRQLRRRVCPFTLLLLFWELGRLEHLIYEPWRTWGSFWRTRNDEGTCSCQTFTSYLLY